ncbi:MAG: hypothetical protein ACJ72E_09180 [Marmoricola sp.]
MNEILTSAITVLALLAGSAALVRWARRGVFLGPVAPVPHDLVVRDDGSGFRPVPAQRTRATAADDVRPATYESHATTAIA